MKPILFLGLLLVVCACSKSSSMGGVNVGNGRQDDTVVSVSGFGLELEYHKSLELKASADRKTVVLGNATRSHLTLSAYLSGQDQRLFDPVKSLATNLLALKLEAGRR